MQPPEFRNICTIPRPNVPFSFVWKAIRALFVLLFIWTAWFTVDPEEAGNVLRFGKFVRQPGFLR